MLPISGSLRCRDRRRTTAVGNVYAESGVGPCIKLQMSSASSLRSKGIQPPVHARRNKHLHAIGTVHHPTSPVANHIPYYNRRAKLLIIT
jgi:hypothetical protein